MHVGKLATSFSLIFFGVALGYGVQVLSQRGILRMPMPLETLRKLLQKIALLFFMPMTVLCAVWIVSVRAASIAALPFIGLSAIVLGGLLAWVVSRLLKLAPRKAGALIPCGAFTNIGSIGALVCFIFLGENGFALVPIYKIFEELSYYSLGFPVAKYYSRLGGPTGRITARIRGLARDPFIIVALASISTGALLNVSEVPRPAFFTAINAVFIPVGTTLLLVSIGLAMKFRSVSNYVKECLAVSAIKFVMVPVTISTVAAAIGFGEIDDGLPLKVVMILSAMPVAFNALIPPSIYDLDLELANSCWFFTTVLLIVVLPVLLSVIGTV
jgi:predicted permease